MAADFLNIPGDIRQQYMPFTIDGPGKKQLFTFKEGVPGNVALIHPFSRYLQTLIANDSSFQYTHGTKSPKKLDYKDFLEAIPGIQIREFVPDAKLTQTFKWFSYLKKGFDAFLNNIDNEAAGTYETVKTKLSQAWDALGEKMQGLTSGNAPILAEVAAGLTHYYRDRGFNVGPDKGFAVLFIPFLLYYRLTTTHTNNIYEIPYSMKNNILESDGTYGWGDDNTSDFPLIEAIGHKFTGAAAALMPGLGSTIKVNAMPSFNPSGSARSTEFTISFDLINDSEEAAVNNFLMCHTLFGNNRWLQYGFVQTGASLYDVKLPGANRYFMCKGRFVCKGKGGFRTPSDKVIQDIVAHHGANKVNNNIHKAWTTSEKNGKTVAEIIGERRALNAISNPQQESERSFLLRKKEEPKSKSSEMATAATDNSIVTGVKAQSLRTFKGSSVTSVAVKKTDGSNEYGEAINVEGGVKRYQEAQIQIKAAKEEIATDKTTIRDLQVEMEKAKIANDRVTKNKEILERLKQNNASYAEIKKAQADVDKATEELEAIVGQDGYESYIAGINVGIKETEEQIVNLEGTIEGLEMSPLGDKNMQKLADQFSTQTLEQASAAQVNTNSSIWKDLIKIPDVYSLELTFSSLIPDNFNNYLYGWRADNLDPIEDYFKKNVDELGAMEKLVQNLIKAVGGGD